MSLSSSWDSSLGSYHDSILDPRMDKTVVAQIWRQFCSSEGERGVQAQLPFSLWCCRGEPEAQFSLFLLLYILVKG